MKNYKHILEAVNRGIQLALDDFDDEEQVQHVKSKQVQNRDYTKEYLDLMEVAVDLGLPSGTLWCKCNLGAKHEYSYGDYYAWGELTTKDENYTDENYMYKGNPKRLPAKRDVATQKLGNNFHIPTEEQFNELIEYTTNKWVSYKNTGFYGRLFTGKNGNTLFIPAAGYGDEDGFFRCDSDGFVWSSDRKDPYFARALSFEERYVHMCSYWRANGISIRPVVNL